MLRPDAAQAEVAERLQVLHDQLSDFYKKKSVLALSSKKPAPRSLYIWGNVGRGKSMLMDVFFEAAPLPAKRRVHFHRFMQEVHARIHLLRQKTQAVHGSGDPVALLIQELQAEVRLLCFDELQATDVADASLIFRLFEGLFAAGVVIVSTSNHPPANLYTGGVQRERFAKCTELLAKKMDVVPLTSPLDYRTQQLKSLQRTYFAPLGRDAEIFVEEVLKLLAPDTPPAPLRLSVHGRELALKAYGDVVVASFAELCGAALGAADYLALADAAETVILTGIPLLTPEKRNEAKRFVTLIDALYEHRTHFICTASAPPEALYPEGDGSFEFRRTVSRLLEMQSERYLEEKG